MTRHTMQCNAKAPRRPRTFRPHTEGLEDRKLMTAGDLDLAFGSGGSVLATAVTNPKQGQSLYDSATAVQVLSNGQILASGSAFGNSMSVARLIPNGTMDSSFGKSGFVTTTIGVSSSSQDMALMADGRFVLAGTANMNVSLNNSGYNDDFAVFRFLPTGALDTSFGGTGKVTTAVSTFVTTDSLNKADRAYGVAVYPQGDPNGNAGKIVVGGFTNDGHGSTSLGYDSLLIRFNVDGTLDSTFGRGGKLVVTRPGDDICLGLAIQTDGKIIATGSLSNGTNNSYYVARYDAAGGLDATFGQGGVLVTPFTCSTLTPSYGIKPVLQGDGSIILAPSTLNGSSHDLAVARITPAGTPDSTFGGTGYVTVDLGGDERCNAVALQADGKILVSGSRSIPGVSNSEDTVLARFQTNGQLDPAFGSGGVVIHSFSAIYKDQFHGVAVYPQGDPSGNAGKIVAVGVATPNYSTGNMMLIARYLGDPTPLRASAIAPAPVHQALTAAQARPALAEALAYWRARGEDTSRLGRIDLAIADLGGDRLGEASGSTITLDDDAAGWGWDVGRSARRGGKSPAARMDLLSAVTHEVGHLLGHDHAEGGVMAETLAPGVRQALPIAPPLTHAATAARLGARSAHPHVGHHRMITRK